MQYQTGQSIPARHDWPGAVIPIRCVLCHSPHWLFWPSWDLRELLFSLCGGRNNAAVPLSSWYTCQLPSPAYTCKALLGHYSVNVTLLIFQDTRL